MTAQQIVASSWPNGGPYADLYLDDTSAAWSLQTFTVPTGGTAVPIDMPTIATDGEGTWVTAGTTSTDDGANWSTIAGGPTYVVW